MFKSIFAILCLPLLASTTVWAFPLPKANYAPTLMSLNHLTTDHNFEGIVALNNCSGSLVRFKNSRDTDRAYVITNGHCFEKGFIAPGTWVYGKPSSRRFAVLNPDSSTAGTITATEVVYATMSSTDLALYRVRETFADIQQRFNVRALTLSDVRPEVGQQLEIISGFWRRGYRCSIEKFIPRLKEGDWTWDDSIRYSRPGCEVIGGTSGSPILSEDRMVIGLNNTGNEDGESCTDNNPCEIDENGSVSQVRGYSYGQQSYWLYSCLNNNNEVDLSVPGCQLPH